MLQQHALAFIQYEQDYALCLFGLCTTSVLRLVFLNKYLIKD